MAEKVKLVFDVYWQSYPFYDPLSGFDFEYFDLGKHTGGVIPLHNRVN